MISLMEGMIMMDKIRYEDLNEDGQMLYCILLLLKELEEAPDRNTERFTKKIKAMKEVLVSELFS